MVDKVERFVFFPLVRTAAFVCAFVLFLAMVAGVIFVVTFKGIEIGKVDISFSELQSGVHPEVVKKLTAHERLRAKKIAGIEKYLSDREVQRNAEWLWDLKSDHLNALSRIVTKAVRQDPENVSAYFANYRQLYEDKANWLGLGATADQLIARTITSAVKGSVVSAVVALFLVFTLLIVLLLLLSIERNTRKEPALQQQQQPQSQPQQQQFANPAPTVSNAVVFPKILACPQCGKRLKANGSGRFICPGCQSALAVDENGNCTIGSEGA